MERFKTRDPYLALLFSMLLLLACAAVAAQSFSHVLSFQGRLADAGTGKPLPDGQYQVTFTIYDAETEGTALWQEVQEVGQVGGIFGAELGSVEPFPEGLFLGGDRWLGVKVGDDPEMDNRFRFTPSPWALYSASSGPDDDWAFSGDDIYSNNAGYVGIGTDTPTALLEVLTPEREHGILSTCQGIPIQAIRTSTTGTWPAIHAQCDSESTNASAIRGYIMSTSPGSSSVAVKGVNHGTGGAGIGVIGTQDGSGYGVYGYTPDGRGVYGHSTDGTGVWGSGGAYGGYFEDSDSSGRANVGYGGYGIAAYGTVMGGYFEDSGASGYAYVGYDNHGILAYGALAGGEFNDSDSSGWAEVGTSTYKVYGNGSVSFVQNHPDDADKVIVYACPEGDEVATYTRGTARLVNGEAVVPLGETFKWVTNPDIGLTAHLTPRGKGSVLYVESLSTREMLVRSMDGFPDDVAFDYIVYGLRIGFEEVSIVQEKQREARIPSMADHRALYEQRTELRDFNALDASRECAPQQARPSRSI